jgi:hypothetical protein
LGLSRKYARRFAGCVCGSRRARRAKDATAITFFGRHMRLKDCFSSGFMLKAVGFNSIILRYERNIKLLIMSFMFRSRSDRAADRIAPPSGRFGSDLFIGFCSP